VGVFQLGAPNAKLLGRCVPIQSQVEEALRLDVYLGKPPKPRRRRPLPQRAYALSLSFTLGPPRKVGTVRENFAHEGPDPRSGLFRPDVMAHGASVF